MNIHVIIIAKSRGPHRYIMLYYMVVSPYNRFPSTVLQSITAKAILQLKSLEILYRSITLDVWPKRP